MASSATSLWRALRLKFLGLELLGVVALSFHWTIPPAAIKSKRENAVT
jgi:hypothetical protein